MLSMLTVPTSGCAAAADQHVGVVRERPPPAVAVADRQGREPGGLARAPAPAVARARRPARSASRRDLGVQRERRLEAVLVGIVAGTGRGRRSRRRSGPGRSGRRLAERRGAVGGVHDERRSRPDRVREGARRRELAGKWSSPSSSAVAKWVISPDQLGRGRQPQRQPRGSFVPSRPIPLSSFT